MRAILVSCAQMAHWQVAHWAVAQGLQTGDSVAIFMPNRLEFVAAWLGLAKIGVTSAWINNSIKLGPLMHSVTCVASTKVLIHGQELETTVAEVRAELTAVGIKTASFGSWMPFGTGLRTAADEDVLGRPKSPPSRSLRDGVSGTSSLCYIYTSGTTGLPKAAIVTHKRYVGAGMGAAGLVKPDDVLYGTCPATSVTSECTG